VRQGLARPVGLTIDAYLLGVTQDPADDRGLEEAALGQEDRAVAMVVEDVRPREGVDVRHVVGREEEATLRGDVLDAGDLVARHGTHPRAQDPGDHPVHDRGGGAVDDHVTSSALARESLDPGPPL
jgi:hypothetical protein